jgi:alpha-amylase
MAPADIAAIKKLLTKPDVFIVQEVPGGTDLSNEYIANGRVWAWDNATYALNLFSFSGNLSQAIGYDDIASSFPDTEKSLTWITNHDTEHHSSGSLTYLNGRYYELANIWMLAEKYGSPMLYSGYAFDEGDWQAQQGEDGRILEAKCAPGSSINTSPDDLSVGVYESGSFVCLQRWNSIKGMIAWRDAVADADKTEIFGADGVYGFGRSGKGYVLINSNSEGYSAPGLKTGMVPGSYCDLISGGGKPLDTSNGGCLGETVEVAADGTIAAELQALSALAISDQTKLN